VNGFGRALMIAGALFAAALASRALVAHAPARLAPDFAQPLVVVTNWNGFGAALLAALVLALALATLAYWRIAYSAGRLSLLSVVAAAALAILAAWWMPVLFSSDVYAYAAYGELARLGGDPYAHAALRRGDAIFDAAIWQWGDPPPVCVYGPAFVAIARAIVAAAASLGLLAQLDAFRVLACVALLLCALLAYGAYPGDRTARLGAAASIGLNPVAIWSAVEGHNDSLAVAIVLTGFFLVRRGLISLGAAAVALSALVKVPGLAAALGLTLVNRRALVGAAAGAAVVAAFSLPLLASIMTRLAPYGRYGPEGSIQAIVRPAAWLVFGAERPAAIAALLVAAAVAVLLAAVGIARLRRGAIDAWVWLALAVWALLPNPYPWYGLWLVALAATAPQTLAGRVAIGLSLTSLLRYVPDAVGAPSPPLSFAMAVGATLPFILLIGYARPSAIMSGSHAR
jgi:alpha-1,6-mannosyltransferase